MNPFQLTGFSFLAFYLILGILMQFGLRAWISNRERQGDVPTPQLSSDPYQIAYLRGGEQEAMRVASISLIDRDLLKADGEQLQTSGTSAIEFAKRPIEKAILAHFKSGGSADSLFISAPARAACEQYRLTLQEHRLMPGSEEFMLRILPILCALALLVAVSAIKINIAFSQGRHNVIFLIILTIIFGIFTLTAYGKRITGRGEAVLADLRILFARLKTRAVAIAPGGDTNEAALLAAIFGITALPLVNFPFLRKLYPDKTSGSGDSGGSGCGSSSSSSCGSSCGGGCGGGCGG